MCLSKLVFAEIIRNVACFYAHAPMNQLQKGRHVARVVSSPAIPVVLLAGALCTSKVNLKSPSRVG
jgi:hypothetical protein